jgi:hypothetical protein
MSGPSVSSGEDSKQDYKTPPEFMEAATKRFGPIGFDLAAHAGNAQHERYFAPSEFVTLGTMEEIASKDGRPGMVSQVIRNGKPLLHKKTKEPIFQKVVKNDDPNAYGFDCFAYSWAELSRRLLGNPLLWLNCEFGDIPRYARKCQVESQLGARILLLTPLSMANWFADHILHRAEAYFLFGRLCFDGASPYPKDCMLTYFSGGSSKVSMWDWKKDKILWTSASDDSKVNSDLRSSELPYEVRQKFYP